MDGRQLMFQVFKYHKVLPWPYESSKTSLKNLISQSLIDSQNGHTEPGFLLGRATLLRSQKHIVIIKTFIIVLNDHLG